MESRITIELSLFYKATKKNAKWKLTRYIHDKLPLWFFLTFVFLCTIALNQLDSNKSKGVMYSIILLVSLVEVYFIFLMLEALILTKSHVKIHYYVDPKSIPEEGLYILSSEHDELLLCGNNPSHIDATEIYFIKKADIIENPEHYSLEKC